jgi:hypothetical protein
MHGWTVTRAHTGTTRARRSPRKLTAAERDALVAVLTHADFQGRDALLEQVDAARVVAHCGCATVDLVVGVCPVFCVRSGLPTRLGLPGRNRSEARGRSGGSGPGAGRKGPPPPDDHTDDRCRRETRNARKSGLRPGGVSRLEATHGRAAEGLLSDKLETTELNDEAAICLQRDSIRCP